MQNHLSTKKCFHGPNKSVDYINMWKVFIWWCGSLTLGMAILLIPAQSCKKEINYAMKMKLF